MKDKLVFACVSNNEYQGGLTLFEYASVAAMQGLLATGIQKDPDVYAKSACDCAAALIAEMERRANDKPKEG